MKTAALTAMATLLALLFSVSIASAHAFVDRAEPKVGSEISAAPTEVKIWFTQEIEPSYSKIEVFDSSGKQIDKLDSHADKEDKRAMIVGLEKLSAGTYKVQWSVVSTDTHRTKGDFKFVIKP